MENELSIQKNSLEIDSLELLIRFILMCQNEAKNNELKFSLDSCIDIVTAVYYYRRYPNVNDFINAYLKENENYFKLQWVRMTWDNLSKMSEHELSNLVINQISLVAKLQKAQ